MTRVACFALLAAACVPEDICDDDDRKVTGHVSTPRPSTPVAADQTIEGTLDDTDVAIARVWAARKIGDEHQQVAVAEAKAGAFNFEQWAVTVPAASFVPLPGESDATIDVLATEVCPGAARDHVIDSFVARANPPADTPVADLKLAVEFVGSEQCYVPVDGSAEATVVVTASAASVGGLVSMQASAGQLTAAALDENGRLRLLADSGGSGNNVGFFAKDGEDGLATIRASAPGAVQQKTTVSIVASPQLDAASTEIAAGAKTTLIATSRGILSTCVATATTTSATVTLRDLDDRSEDVSLLRGPVAAGTRTCAMVGTAADPLVDAAVIDVAFDAMATPDTLVRVTCSDTYGQPSNAVVVTLPPEP